MRARIYSAIQVPRSLYAASQKSGDRVGSGDGEEGSGLAAAARRDVAVTGTATASDASAPTLPTATPAPVPVTVPIPAVTSTNAKEKHAEVLRKRPKTKSTEKAESAQQAFKGGRRRKGGEKKNKEGSAAESRQRHRPRKARTSAEIKAVATPRVQDVLLDVVDPLQLRPAQSYSGEVTTVWGTGRREDLNCPQGIATHASGKRSGTLLYARLPDHRRCCEVVT